MGNSKRTNQVLAVLLVITITLVAYQFLRVPSVSGGLSVLHVVGGRILDENNNNILLRGINFETWIYDFDDGTENANGQFVRVGHRWTWTSDKGTSWDTSTAEGIATEQAIQAHFQEMKNWGMNCVRMHFSISPWLNDVNRAPVDQYRYHLKRCAEIANEVGLYVIYDCAEYKQHSYPWAEYPFYPYDANAPVSFGATAFADWWGEVADYFDNAPNVIFEIYNEPHPGHSISHDAEYSAENLQAWQSLYNNVIARIRAHSQNIVLAQYGYGLDGWYSDPVGVSWIFDYPLSGGNIAYSVHIYRYYNHLGLDQPTDRATLLARLTTLDVIGPNSPINRNFAPMLIAEIGAYTGIPDELTAFGNIMDILEAGGAHYIAFEWGWPGRAYSMLQDQPMMAQANAAGYILQDALR